MTGERDARQEYFIGYIQDEWKARPNFTMNFGVRMDKYTPLREGNDLAIMFDTVKGGLLPKGTAFSRPRRYSSLAFLSHTRSALQARR